MSLDVGDAAPDFTLDDQHGTPVRLSEFAGAQGSPVVLVFYPFAFTGVCTGELAALQAELGSFERAGARLLTVSCDTKYALRVFAEQEGLTFSLLSDFWPHGQTADAYGVLDSSIGAATRGTFVIDNGGVVRWTVRHGLREARDVDGYFKALADLT